MDMDRNINPDGCGKYAVINLRRLNQLAGHVGTFQRWTPEVEQALKTLEGLGVLEWGRVGDPDEFFLVKLKDPSSKPCLLAYANDIRRNDPQFAAAVDEMATRAGVDSPFCRTPD